MRDKEKMWLISRFKKACGGTLLAAALVAGTLNGMSVHAMNVYSDEQPSDSAQESTEIQNSAFDIEAEVLTSDKDTYNVQVKIRNNGEDWDGIVRVVPQEDYISSGYYSGRVPDVYDTVLSLPNGSEKQFMVKIPRGSVEYEGSSIRVALLDEKSKVVGGKVFARLLLDEMESISLGILSDAYVDLTYLDLGGMTIYYYATSMPIKLVDMTQSKLVDTLDGLSILVIDEYNTEILTDEELKALALWIDNGGVLIVGTGASASETLEGLWDVIPEVEYQQMSQPGTATQSSYGDEGVLDVTKLSMVSLRDKGNEYSESYFTNGLVAPVGDGAVGIVPYSLVELGKKTDAISSDMPREHYVLNVLEEFSSVSSSRYDMSQNTMNTQENMSGVRMLLGILGNANTSLNFGILKVLIILYVIFAGPVLYLILRVAKKREWYWVAVPVAAGVGILVVFLAGRGFEVVSTRMYSVTTEDLSGKQNVRSYLYGYNANYREWDLQMAEGYDYAGCLKGGYNHSYEDNIGITKYAYRTQNEGGRISIGIKPQSAFEDSYFQAGKNAGEASTVGTLELSDVAISWSNLEGVVTNNTDKNLEYFAVIINDSIYVYKNLAAGGQCSLGSATPIYRSGVGFQLRSEYIYDFVREVYEGDIKEDVALTAALGIGIKDAYPMNDTDKIVVCGVTKDWDKTIDDNCNETSYGCVYRIYQ